MKLEPYYSVDGFASVSEQEQFTKDCGLILEWDTSAATSVITAENRVTGTIDLDYSKDADALKLDPGLSFNAVWRDAARPEITTESINFKID